MEYIDIGGWSYHVEIAVVLDATASMKPIMEEVKDNVLKFYRKLVEAMKKEGEEISVMRIKVITFRDFAYDGDKALEESRFFNLPEESEDFRQPGPFFTHTIFNIVEGSSQDMAFLIDSPVTNSQKSLGKFGCHTEKGSHFHPEEGAGSSCSKCCSDTNNVAGSDGCG